jgi:putative flippase GtrA
MVLRELSILKNYTINKRWAFRYQWIKKKGIEPGVENYGRATFKIL